MLLTEFNMCVDKWLNENTIVKVNETFCKRCGEPLMADYIGLSIHDGWSVFKQHTGSGKVKRFGFPKCTKCGISTGLEEIVHCIDI